MVENQPTKYNIGIIDLDDDVSNLNEIKSKLLYRNQRRQTRIKHDKFLSVINNDILSKYAKPNVKFTIVDTLEHSALNSQAKRRSVISFQHGN